jgi:phosphate transport system substrate-binding protein
MTITTFRRIAAPIAIAAALGLPLAACGGDDSGSGSGSDLSGAIAIDGSSTVFPLSSAAAELFNKDNPNVQVSVGQSGTGGGFEKFCVGETDISDASRPIKDEEKEACATNDVEFQEMVVANDALTVIVNSENTWATCLTTAELKKIWEPNSTVKNWNEVRSSFPDEALVLAGPGTDSGTFDYFTAEINGEEDASRTDYTGSEDDNVIVQAVSGSKGGLGYLGFSYFEENAEALKAVEIDNGDGCVAPSAATVQDGTYTPLGRPLFIYPSKTSFAEKAQVAAFVEFYVNNTDAINEAAAFIPLNDEQKQTLQDELAALKG